MQKRTDENIRKTSVTAVIRDCLNIIKNIDKRILSTVLATMMILTSFGFVTKYYTFGYNVYYGDVNVGVISSKEKAMEAYTEAVGDVTGRTRTVMDDITFTMTIASVSDITDSDIYRGIVEAAEGYESCYAVEAEGICVAKLKTKAEAQKAVEDYTKSFGREDAQLYTSYKIANSKAIVTELASVDEAVELIDESELFAVVYKDVTEEQVELEYTSTIVEDETIPEGARVLKQQGRNGKGIQKNITFYENGVQKHSIAPVIETVEEPVEEIVHIGTGKMVGLYKDSLSFPTNGRFTSEYGRRWGRNHNGIDIAAKTGTPIYAPAMGIVTFSGKRSGYGNYVEIDHGNGYTTTYAHMSARNVSEGDYVAAGELVGTVGSTGRVTGPHLHFEILLNGRFVDPMDYIAEG